MTAKTPLLAGQSLRTTPFEYIERRGYGQSGPPTKYLYISGDDIRQSTVDGGKTNKAASLCQLAKKADKIVKNINKNSGKYSPELEHNINLINEKIRSHNSKVNCSDNLLVRLFSRFFKIDEIQLASSRLTREAATAASQSNTANSKIEVTLFYRPNDQRNFAAQAGKMLSQIEGLQSGQINRVPIFDEFVIKYDAEYKSYSIEWAPGNGDDTAPFWRPESFCINRQGNWKFSVDSDSPREIAALQNPDVTYLPTGTSITLFYNGASFCKIAIGQ